MIPNPMRRPHGMATNYILRLTPIGMDINEVLYIIEGHRNWHIGTPNFERGFLRPPDVSSSRVGEKSITARGHPLGSGYWPAPIPVPIWPWFFRTIVSIYWGFDADGKLIEVYVHQSHGK